jgi:hypothetical protein
MRTAAVIVVEVVVVYHLMIIIKQQQQQVGGNGGRIVLYSIGGCDYGEHLLRPRCDPLHLLNGPAS